MRVYTFKEMLMMGTFLGTPICMGVPSFMLLYGQANFMVLAGLTFFLGSAAYANYSRSKEYLVNVKERHDEYIRQYHSPNMKAIREVAKQLSKKFNIKAHLAYEKGKLLSPAKVGIMEVISHKKRAYISFNRYVRVYSSIEETRGIMAHEFAHVAAGHITLMQAQKCLNTALYHLGGIHLGANIVGMINGAMPVSVSAMTMPLLTISSGILSAVITKTLMSRAMEYQADRIASDLTGDALIHAFQNKNFQSKGSHESSNRRSVLARIFSTHPSITDRIEHIERHLQRHKAMALKRL